MQLLKKYHKQMTMAFLASGMLSLATNHLQAQTIEDLVIGATDVPELGYDQELPLTDADIPSDNKNEALISQEDLNTNYTIAELLSKAIRYIGLKISETEGIDLLDTDKYIENSEHFKELKKLLTESVVTEGDDLMEQLASLVSQLKEHIAAIEALEIHSGQGPTYLEAINTLKQRIHYVDAHLDFSANVPSIPFNDIMYGEGSPDESGTVAVRLSIDGSSYANSTAYPIPDLQWPNNVKPENIQISIAKDFGSTYIVNEGIDSYVDILPYDPNKLGTADLTINGSDMIKYTIKDTLTGQINSLELTISGPLTTEARSSQISSIGPVDFETATTPISISVSEVEGKDIIPSRYWVNSDTYNDLKNALDDAVKAILNAYKKAKVDTNFSFEAKFNEDIFLSDSFNNLTSLLLNETFDADSNIVALLPNETEYSSADLTSTDLVYSSLSDISVVTQNLNDAYNAYLINATLGSGELIQTVTEGKLEVQIAKAILGLDPNLALPIIPSEGNIDLRMMKSDLSGTVFNQFKNKFNGDIASEFDTDGSVVGSIYVYTKKATQKDIDEKTLDAESGMAVSSIGAPVLSTKAEADGILYYYKSTNGGSSFTLNGLKEGFAEDAEYFIVPAISDDSCAVGKWTPGGNASGLSSVAQNYINSTTVTVQLRILKDLLAEYDQYDGYDLNGNKLGDQQYYDEVNAGAEPKTESGYKATTKIGLVIEKLTKFYTGQNYDKIGEATAKATELDKLRKYLIYFGYATIEGDTFTLVDDKIGSDTNNSALDGLALNIKKPVDASNNSTAVAKITLPENFLDTTLESITPRSEFYNISEYYGVDIKTVGHFWVTPDIHNNLVNGLKRVHNLFESNFITQSKIDVEHNTNDNYLTGSNLSSVLKEENDNKQYTYEEVQAEVVALQKLIDAYENASMEQQYTTFKAKFIDKTLTDSIDKIKAVIALPEEPEYQTLYQTKLAPTLSKTAISEDGVFEITRHELANNVNYTAFPDDVSTIQNKVLIDDSTITHYYTLSDLKTVMEEIQPILDIYALNEKGHFSNLHNANEVEKKVMKGIIENYFAPKTDEMSEKNNIFAVEENLGLELHPIVPYKTTRDELIATIGTISEVPLSADESMSEPEESAIRALIGLDKNNNNTPYIKTTDSIVISEDNGYTYITYDLVKGTWLPPQIFPKEISLQWTTKEALKTYNDAIMSAEKVVLDSRPIEVYKIGGGPDNDVDLLPDNTLGEKINGAPDLTLTFAKASLDPDILSEIKNAMPSKPDGEDYFETRSTTLLNAKSTFEATYKDPQDVSAATAALMKFKTSVGNAYGIETAGENPPSHKDYGFIASDNSALTIVGTGLKNLVYAVTNKDGQVTDYVPVNFYISDDNIGIVNPITKQLYGYDSDGHALTTHGNLPSEIVANSTVTDLVNAIKKVDEFLAKSDSVHLKGYENWKHSEVLEESNEEITNTYFSDVLIPLQTAVDNFNAANKVTIQSEDYVLAYENILAHIVDSDNQTAASKITDFIVNENTLEDIVLITLDKNDTTKISTVELGLNVQFSLDGINKCDQNGVAFNDPLKAGYWITPTVFNNLKNAIFATQEIVTNAKSLNADYVAGYSAAETEAGNEYFNNLYAATNLETAIESMLPRVVEVIEESDANKWIERAKIVLYGAHPDSTNEIPKADEPGGSVPDINISEVTGGFDILNIAMLSKMNTDEDTQLSEEELLTAKDINTINLAYVSKEFADKLKSAIIAVESHLLESELEKLNEIEDEPTLVDKVKKLAELINQAQNPNIVELSLSQQKVMLYNEYVLLNSMLLDDKQQEILVSDTQGKNVPEDRKWVRTAIFNALKSAIANSETLLNNVAISEELETAFKNQLENQYNTNVYTKTQFVPQAGTLTAEQVTSFNEAKKGLLDTINEAATLTGQKEYLENGEQNPNAIVLEEGQIVVSTLFGTDVIGHDKDGNYVPDSGAMWTSLAAHNALVKSINAAVNSYVSGFATEESLKIAQNTLKVAIKNLIRFSFYGTKSTYETVVTTMKTYISIIKNGSNDNGVSIPALDFIKPSNLAGADISPTLLWAKEEDKRNLEKFALAAQNIISTYANVDKPDSKIELARLVLEMNKIKTVFETFYGKNINGQIIEGITPKTTYGTAGIQTNEIKAKIAEAVDRINDLVYLHGATPPKLFFTLPDGTPNQNYGYDRLILDGDNWKTINDEDGHGNDVDEDSMLDTLVSSKERGIDVPFNGTDERKWISVLSVNQLATTIDSAQRVLDNFEATLAAGGQANQLILDNTIKSLDLALHNFNIQIQTVTELSKEAEDYWDIYKELAEAVTEAYATLGRNAEGKEESVTLVENGPLGLDKSIHLSISGDGQDIDKNNYWVSLSTYNTFLNSIQSVVNAMAYASTTEKSLTNAFNYLKSAATNINTIAKNGRSEDRIDLVNEIEQLISDATLLLNGNPGAITDADKYPLTSSMNGSDISANRRWATTGNIKELNTQIFAAKTIIHNLTTEQNEETGLIGTGKTTIALLERSKTSLQAAIAKLNPQVGANTANKEAAEAKAALKRTIDKASLLAKHRVSMYEGTDLPDGIPWITSLSVAGFKYQSEDAPVDIRPTTYIAQAARNAMTIYIKSVTSTDAQVFIDAKNILDYCIDQFENVKDNKTPEGNKISDGKTYYGVGSLSSINEQKALIISKIAEVNAIIRATQIAESNSTVKDGIYWATAENIKSIKDAITKANTDMTNMLKVATTKNEESGNYEGGSITYLQTVLLDLQTAYHNFNTQRQLKGQDTKSALEKAGELLTDLFAEETSQVVIPLQADGTSADLVFVETYLTDLINNLGIIDDNISLTLSGTTISIWPIDGSSTTPEGVPGLGTANITLSRLTEGETVDISANFKVAAKPYQWNEITKASILEAATVIDNTEFEIDGALLSGEDKGTNANMIAMELDRQVNELINNPAIEVQIIGGDILTEDAWKMTSNLIGHTDVANAFTKEQTNDTDSNKGEAGEFTFNVALRISIEDVPQIRSIANALGIESKLTAIINDSDDGTTSSNEHYAVMFNTDLIATVNPAAYIEVSMADVMATEAALETFNNNVGSNPLRITNTLEVPGNTEGLAKAQLSKQIAELLEKDYTNFKGVTFEIKTVGDFPDLSAGAGKYKFAIKFIKGNAVAVTSNDSTFTTMGINIEQTPTDYMSDFARKVEAFPTFVQENGPAFQLDTSNATDKTKAYDTMLAFIKGIADLELLNSTAITLEDVEYKAPILSTPTRFGINGSFKFAVKLSETVRTFVITTPIVALAYDSQVATNALVDQLAELGIDVNELPDFEEESISRSLEEGVSEADGWSNSDYSYYEEEYDEEFQEEYYYEETVYDETYYNGEVDSYNEELYFEEEFFEEEFETDYNEFEEEFLDEFVNKNNGILDNFIKKVKDMFKRS